MASLLNYLEFSPLGSLVVPDFKEGHLIIANDSLKLIDLDDVNNLEPECGLKRTSDDKCPYGLSAVSNITSKLTGALKLQTTNQPQTQKIFIALIKEIDLDDKAPPSRYTIPGYSLVNRQNHPQCGIAPYARAPALVIDFGGSTESNGTQRPCIKTGDTDWLVGCLNFNVIFNCKVISETALGTIENVLPHCDVRSACTHHTQSQTQKSRKIIEFSLARQKSEEEKDIQVWYGVNLFRVYDE
ncbi:protein kinase domain-containing protein, cytoplasmic [Elysia marginata]|uniref:Protein kinase domain-containing protein, cytoplasmic n=1 Tax=Elysia marginata TaxID=1093978 RepID=A0AAV4JVH8_9GAST|nr:protein kinase domain-containing protein, cytoplasmic [Elysia marginata]